ncbi:MAG: alanine--tRNA ligase [Candidatus Diapherotrites archaeon]|nr:alanine--tRNA ligase [Candidatus Diapherotrites archaeon]
MKPDKQVKAEFRETASKNPEKHYPVSVLKQNGFSRHKCQTCGKFFWSVSAGAKACGDPACSGGYRFVGDSPAKKQFDYLEAWQAFKKFFKNKGYYEYKPYPVVARWREDVYWVGASVYPFQPFVVSGEIKPKSNAAIIPQPCLRFNDIDNVGITGSHYVCFDMLGQLHFEKAQDYDLELYWSEYFEWLTKGMGVPSHELAVHEDAWAGGGNFGPCMEFFSRGMEIGNQVYMQYKTLENGFEELQIKVLDMGQGHERIPWFTTGKSTSYETTFPPVARHLYKLTGLKADEKFMQSFLPYSALLNVDEVEDVESVWQMISKKLGVEKTELKEKVLSLAALYSVAEHSRAALFALNDGALPSNVGGGYNLRVIMRRMFELSEKNDWQVDFSGLVEMHAAFLKPLYPALSQNLPDVSEIIENEKQKFHLSRERAAGIIKGVVTTTVSLDKLVELYDSHGISPEAVAAEAKRAGQKVNVPDNFYALVAERHENREQATKTKKDFQLDLSGLPDTEILYYGDWKTTEFSAKVLRVVSNEFVVLDKTAFYPTSGGQLFDTGFLDGARVVDVFRQGKIIVHKLENNSMREGMAVKGKIDFERRKQLMQHHSGVHVLNLCARKVLGPHVYQAGAAKTTSKARLDITHYDNLSDEQVKKIQQCCSDAIKKDLVVKKEFLPREEAEEKYGMRIYQGGFIPGRNLRIVTIGDDVEACGGTHANRTGEIGQIKIIGSSKVQDGIIRLNLVAGHALESSSKKESDYLVQTAGILGVRPSLVPGRVEELFSKWKKAKKALKQGKKPEQDLFALFSAQETMLDEEGLLKKASAALSTKPEHLPNTVKRFLRELEELRKKSLGQK